MRKSSSEFNKSIVYEPREKREGNQCAGMFDARCPDEGRVCIHGEVIEETGENETADGMRLLFSIDSKDYGECTHTYIRNSARSIIIRNGRIAMVHSLKYDYYKFPGGGIEEGEETADAAVRETMEEAGLKVIRNSVEPYGYVHRIQKSTSDETECFIQDNLYYLCETEETPGKQKLDDYEAEEQFTLKFVAPEEAIRTNRADTHGPKDRRSLEREAKVLELLIAEGYFIS